MAVGDRLTRIQKYQIFTTGGILILELLAYTLFGLLQGFEHLNTWILNHFVAVIFFAVLPFSLVPTYSAVDDLWTKLLKQFTFTGLLIVSISAITWMYYQFHPPTTGFGRIASWFARAIGIYGLINIAFLPGIQRKTD